MLNFVLHTTNYTNLKDVITLYFTNSPFLQEKELLFTKNIDGT